MQNTSLASRYRPQTFSEVAGQDMVKAVLSRAAVEDKVAPAYLFSGTRGVGKTTIARIFAKTLNCVHSPTDNPCNECDQCKKITLGNHVDVIEIDGASNNSVDDARALREKIGYAPMEGRYKIFIIDEAHMLSKAAFNALLKTLEEPPKRVVFIFATTEVHKFPITIVSRCQHFIFRHLSETAIYNHLIDVLQQEGLEFEPNAVRLISRRAAGSVRDSMSLLDQSLALGNESLSEKSVRDVLGLAGQEMFISMLDAMADENCIEVTQLLRRLLDQGIDIGFFLHEFADIWRILFLIRQAGEKVLATLDIPKDEGEIWLKQADRFSLQHIHAAWQMLLDTQRRIINSPEPAAALELMLLNLALLPRLLPLSRLDTIQAGQKQERQTVSPHQDSSAKPLGTATTEGKAGQYHQTKSAVQSVNADKDNSPKPEISNSRKCIAGSTGSAQSENTEQQAKAVISTNKETTSYITSASSSEEEISSLSEPEENAFTWSQFCNYCTQEYEAQKDMPLPRAMLTQAEAQLSQGRCTIYPSTVVFASLLEKHKNSLESLLSAFCHKPVRAVIIPPKQSSMTQTQIRAEFEQRPEIRLCCDILDAKLANCKPIQ